MAENYYLNIMKHIIPSTKNANGRIVLWGSLFHKNVRSGHEKLDEAKFRAIIEENLLEAAKGLRLKLSFRILEKAWKCLISMSRFKKEELANILVSVCKAGCTMVQLLILLPYDKKALGLDYRLAFLCAVCMFSLFTGSFKLLTFFPFSKKI